MVNGVTTDSVLLKQSIILTCINNPAGAHHVCGLLIESKRKLIVLKGNINEFNTWVEAQMD